MWDGSVKTTGECQCRAGYQKNGNQCTGLDYFIRYSILLCKIRIMFCCGSH